MLKPSKDDPNYEAEIERWKKDPQAFGQSHVGVKLPDDWKPGELKGVKVEKEEKEEKSTEKTATKPKGK